MKLSVTLFFITVLVVAYLMPFAPPSRACWDACWPDVCAIPPSQSGHFGWFKYHEYSTDNYVLLMEGFCGAEQGTLYHFCQEYGCSSAGPGKLFHTDGKIILAMTVKDRKEARKLMKLITTNEKIGEEALAGMVTSIGVEAKIMTLEAFRHRPLPKGSCPA